MTDRYRRGAERMEAEYVRIWNALNRKLKTSLTVLTKNLMKKKPMLKIKDKDKLEQQRQKDC